jgi:hypothetical protein
VVEQPEPPVTNERESYEGWLRRAQKAQRVLDTEINVQVGDITLKTARLELLDRAISRKADFVSVFGESKDAVQCAEVKKTQYRNWVRLVGLRHDCLLWERDKRVPSLPFGYVRKYTLATLLVSEKWIGEALEPCMVTPL